MNIEFFTYAEAAKFAIESRVEVRRDEDNVLRTNACGSLASYTRGFPICYIAVNKFHLHALESEDKRDRVCLSVPRADRSISAAPLVRCEITTGRSQSCEKEAALFR